MVPGRGGAWRSRVGYRQDRPGAYGAVVEPSLYETFSRAEWEKLRDPDATADDAVHVIEDRPPAVTRNARAFRVLVRNALFRRVELAALHRWDELSELDNGVDWEAALKPYFEEYGEIGIGPDARGPALLMIDAGRETWTVRQIFDDPNGDHDWAISAEIDLVQSDEIGAAAVRVTAVGPA